MTTREFLITALVFIVFIAAPTYPKGNGVAAELHHRPDTSLPWVTRRVRAPRVEYRTFESKTVGTKVSYHVYKPMTYDRDRSKRFPVLYWLHGTGGGVAHVRPLARLFHGWMQAGKVPPMLVVFANGLRARLWCNSKDGSSPVETMFIEELIPEAVL